MKNLRHTLAASILSVLAAAGLTAGGCDGDEPGGDPTGTASTGPSTGTTSGTGGSGGGGGGGIPVGECVAASGAGTDGSNTWQDAPHQATVEVQSPDTCARTYVLSTTGPLRDNQPQNPRTFSEQPGQPVLRTGHAMFDALYALAVEESREASVDAISNYAFNNGQPVQCPPGGCFETGRLWTYVWTRDTAYSVALGLGLLDPTRARNSLEFKLSPRRDGTRREIVQDTGTGGSWPISTDRVVWAMGAWELLKFLDGDERTAFRDLAYDAVVNTAERDRLVAWDADDGLYRGEQSFLDWRENTYPLWTATDPVQIGMSKALGTNIGHLSMLEVASKLAEEKGDAAAAQRYAGWASALRDAIRARLWLQDRGLYSTYVTTWLDQAPAELFDLLGEAFAVLHDVATPEQASTIVASYPHLPKGAPVIWPQQQDTRIYHNRGIWPFVTAFWAKAAAKAGSAEAIDHAVRSLARGAALNLSHMENFEAVTGANYKEEGPTSGPVVNSQRQLWSVAGYLGVVHDVIFGMEATQTGVRFLPKITGGLRGSLFAGADRIALSNLRYKGRRLSVSVALPADAGGSGVLQVASVRLNGQEVGTDFIDAAALADDNLFEIELGQAAPAGQGLRLVDDAAIADYRNVFGPRTPAISGLSIVNDRVEVSFSVAESALDVRFNIYRDGVRVAAAVPGSVTTWLDAGSAQHATRTYCYTVEAVFTASGNASQRARPWCYWGPNAARIQTFGAQGFQANGGTLVFNHGRWHHENWGDPQHTLTVINVTAQQTGRHLLQVVAGNGAGDFTTGVTCGVKAIEVWQGANLIGGGQLLMPQLASWDEWRDSSFVPVDLVAGTTYTIVIREDEASGNMSDLQHFALYSGTGGASGRFNMVNITEVKLLSMGTP